MKILLISESLLEKKNGIYHAVDPWIRFPVQLATHCEKMSLLAPVRELSEEDTPSPQSWKLNPGTLQIVPHDQYNSFAGYFKLWLKRHCVWKKHIQSLIADHDLVLLRIPSPLVSVVSDIAKELNKPYGLLLAGDIQAQSDRLAKSRGVMRLVYKIFLAYFVRKERIAATHSSILFAYSEELAARHHIRRDIVRLIRTPHLSLKDFGPTPTGHLREPIRLLRVAWLLPTKGIDHLLEALALLVNKGFNMVLEIVGQEREAGYENYLKAKAQELGISDRVTFTGWMSFDRIKVVYDRSDIQVISSLSEGTPRVIVEGAAFGLPLVSTAVGGCKDVLFDRQNALLVGPADPILMANAIQELITNDSLRKRIALQGYEDAKNSTFEMLGVSIAQDLACVVDQSRKAHS